MTLSELAQIPKSGILLLRAIISKASTYLLVHLTRTKLRYYDKSVTCKPLFYP